MRKKSILMVCISALIALAVFVGCDNAPVYPAWPTGGYVSQVGDILNGQAFDASKFQVVATYLDNSKKVIDASVVFEDVDKSGNVTAGDTVSSTVGTDYYGSLVTATGTVSVYNIDSIDFTVAEGVDYTSLEAGDLAVTANYYNGKGELAAMPLSSTEYTVSVSSEAGEEDTTVYTITVTTSVGGNVKSSEKVSVANEPEVLGTIVGITTITPNNYSVPGFLYDELPAIDASKFRIGVLLEDGDATSGTVDGDTIEGLELAFVNQTTGAVLDKALDEYDFRNATDIGVRATFEGKSIYTADAITVDEATLTVEYKGAGIAENATLPEIIPADYRVLLTVGSNKAVDITEEANLYYAEEDWTATTDKTMTADGITVVASYMGILNSTKIEAGEAAPVTVESVEFTMAEGWAAPAKQYYNTLPSLAKTSVVDIVVTTNYGVENYDNAAASEAFAVAYYTAEGKPLSEAKATTVGDYDALANVDSILVGLTLGDKTYYKSYDLEEANIGTVRLQAVYGNSSNGSPMQNTTIDWVIQTSNDYGMISYDYTGEYEAWIDGVKTTLPVIADKAYTNIFVKVGDKESAPINIATPTAYIDASSIKVGIASTYKPLVGDVISTTVGDYAIVEKSWTPVGEGATDPVIESIILPATGAKVAVGSNVDVEAVVKYVDGTGKEVKVPVSVEAFDGISYTDVTSIKLSYANHPEVGDKELESGFAYDFRAFSIDSESVTEVGDDSNLKIVGYVEGSTGLDDDGMPVDGYLTSGVISTSWVSKVYTIIVSYTDKTTGEIDYIDYVFSLKA